MMATSFVLGVFALTHMLQSLVLAGLVFGSRKLLPDLDPAQRYSLGLISFLLAALLPFAICLPASPVQLVLPALPIEPHASLALILGLAIIAWLAGLAWFAIGLARSLFSTHRIIASARPISRPTTAIWLVRALDLKLSDAISTPLVAGLARPLVLVPTAMESQLDNDAVRGLIEHECAHIERRDLWAVLLQRILLAVYWWNPLMHGLASSLDADRELACDDIAARRHGDARAYAASVLDVADQMIRGPELAFSAAAVSNRHELARRIRRLMDGQTSASNPILPGLMTGLVLACSLLLVAAAPRPLVQVTSLSQAERPLIESRDLVQAIRNQSDPVVARLLAAGANPNTRLPDNTSALSEALVAQNALIIDRLLNAGADSNTTMPDGESALHWAIRHRVIQNIAALIASGADLNATNSDGETPLSLALQIGDEQTIRLLLEAGAQPQ